MKHTIYIFVNGVLTFPGEHSNWTGRAVTHCMAERGVQAEKIEYLAFATIDRLLGQKRRVDRMQKTLQRYINKGFDIVIAAHSNGCDVTLDTLSWLDWPRVKELHFFAAACEADMNLNGLNQALRDEKVGRFKFYNGGKDFPMKLANTWAGWLFGYGTHPLGRSGPLKLDADVESRVVAHTREDFGHSSWWERENFNRSMDMILGDKGTAT